MATEHYLTKEQREAQEDAELEAAEKAYNESNGLPTDAPTHSDEVTDQGTRGTQVDVEATQQKETDWEKRYKDLQSHHDKTINELRGQLKEAGVEPESDDEIATLKQQLDELRSKESERETQDVVAKAQEAVRNAHPDFIGVISSPEFSEWIQGQPEIYSKAIYDERPDARLAIDALTLFKVQNGYSDRERTMKTKNMQDQAAMAVNSGHREVPDTNTKKIWTWNEINKLTPQQYDKYEKDIDEAIIEGRIR